MMPLRRVAHQGVPGQLPMNGEHCTPCVQLRGRCGSLFSLGVCRSHCSPLLRFLKNGKWSVADSNSMAPALWVDGQWQLVTISKSNPSSAVRFVTAESGPPPPDEPLSGTSEVHPLPFFDLQLCMLVFLIGTHILSSEIRDCHPQQ